MTIHSLCTRYDIPIYNMGMKDAKTNKIIAKERVSAY